MPERPPAGWYPNPEGRGQRYWDGEKWTQHFYGAAETPAAPPPPKGSEPAAHAESQPAAGPPTAPTTQTASPMAATTTGAASGTRKKGPAAELWGNFRKLPTVGQWAIAIGAVILVVAVAASGSGDKGGGGGGGSDDSAEEAAVTNAAPKKEVPLVVLTIPTPHDGARLQRQAVGVGGTVRPANARVIVNGKRVQVRPNGRWGAGVPLKVGENTITVNATSPGYRTTHNVLTVTRVLTAAEREERAAAALEKFKNDAITIDYNKLEKNPEKYTGKKVVYRGQIFQIQESGDLGGILLLAVTDEGYGIWDDNIWVNYESSIESAEDDVITVYGVVKGSRSYETQIGGETYVPEIDAKYIEEDG